MTKEKGKKKDESETKKKKNSSWFSRRCQGANGMIGERSRGRMVSGIQVFSRRHVRWERQGTNTYYKSSRGPSAKEMSVAKNEGKRRSAGGRREEERGIGLVAVCGPGVCGHDRTSPPVFTRYHRKSMIARFNEIPLSPSCLYTRLPSRFLYARENPSVRRVSRYIVFLHGIDDAGISRESCLATRNVGDLSRILIP